VYELRFTGISRISFLMKFLRSNPLSRAHLLIPMLLIFYFLSRDDSAFSPVFSCCKFQKANFVAYFPFAICFLADITD
jgi:hypothetical protein